MRDTKPLFVNSMNKQKLAESLGPIVSRMRTDVSAVKKDGKMSWTRDPLTLARQMQHVNGGPARGLCPIKAGESVTMVAVFDLDSHKGQTSWQAMCGVALEIMDTLRMCDMSPMAWRSSGGSGIHIYLIWDDPQDAYSVRLFLSEILASCGFKNGTAGVSKQEIEIFPKQDSVPIDGYGSQIILPLAGLSEPLEYLLDLESMGKEYALDIDYPSSDNVPVRIRPVRPVPVAGSSGGEERETLRQALAAIGNEGDAELDYDAWRNVVFAIHDGTDGDDGGLALAHEFSARSSKYDGDFLDNNVWPHIRSRVGGITTATIFAMARDAGWEQDFAASFDIIGPGFKARQAAESAEAGILVPVSVGVITPGVPAAPGAVAPAAPVVQEKPDLRRDKSGATLAILENITKTLG